MPPFLIIYLLLFQFGGGILSGGGISIGSTLIFTGLPPPGWKCVSVLKKSIKSNLYQPALII